MLQVYEVTRSENTAGLPAVDSDRAQLFEVIQNLADKCGKIRSDRVVGRSKIGAHISAFNELADQSGIGLIRIDAHSRSAWRVWIESSAPQVGITFCFALAGQASTRSTQAGL